MTLLSVVQEVCSTVGVAVPTAVIPRLSTDRTMVEMFNTANEMAQRIAADTRDWTALKTYATFAGDGIKTAFALPADYRRMPISSNLWVSNYGQSPARFIPNSDEWLKRRADTGTTAVASEWTIIGGQMQIWPAMGVDVTASFVYLHKNSVVLASGGLGYRFMDDADGYILDERLLKLGMIWEWKKSKGSPYAEDMGTYTDALANAMGFDSPAPIIVGHLPISANARVAYPWPAPTGYIT